MTEPEDMRDENIWGVIGDTAEWMQETQVSLGVVVILLLIGVIREGLSWWFKYKGPYQ